MPSIAAGPVTADVDLVAFDKDGTLIDFHHLWMRKTRLAVEAVVREVAGSAALFLAAALAWGGGFAHAHYALLAEDGARGFGVGDGESGPFAVVLAQHERPYRARDVAALALLDLDHLGAEVREVRGAERPGAVYLHAEDAHAREGQHQGIPRPDSAR